MTISRAIEIFRAHRNLESAYQWWSDLPENQRDSVALVGILPDPEVGRNGVDDS